MRYLVLILGFLACSIAKADFAPIVVYRTDDGRLAAWLGPNGATQWTSGSLPRFWTWEGGGTSVDIKASPGVFDFDAKVDIAGPPWLYIHIIDDAEGLKIEARHSHEQWEVGWRYRNYSAMLASSFRFKDIVVSLLTRIGQRDDLPTLSEIRSMLSPPPMNSGMRAEMLSIIESLDDPDWKVRRSAAESLRRFVPWIPLLDRREMTPEQDMAIDRILAWGEMFLPRAFVNELLNEDVETQ